MATSQTTSEAKGTLQLCDYAGDQQAALAEAQHAATEAEGVRDQLAAVQRTLSVTQARWQEQRVHCDEAAQGVADARLLLQAGTIGDDSLTAAEQIQTEHARALGRLQSELDRLQDAQARLHERATHLEAQQSDATRRAEHARQAILAAERAELVRRTRLAPRELLAALDSCARFNWANHLLQTTSPNAPQRVGSFEPQAQPVADAPVPPILTTTDSLLPSSGYWAELPLMRETPAWLVQQMAEFDEDGER